MAELMTGFEQLNESGKQDLLAFMNELLAKKEKRKKPFDREKWKEDLLKIDVWPEDVLESIESARTHFNEWKPREW